MKQPRRAKQKTKQTKKPVSAGKKYSKLFFSVFLIIAVVAGICLGCDFSAGNDDMTDDNVIAPVDIKEGKINVLLLGVDIEGLRTDAMMIASYDISENKVNLLSIPRDTRMYIGTKYQKINAAHAIGGMKGKIAGPEGSIEAVTRLTAIPINYYLEFSFGAIDNFINALGGVDFEVPDVEGKGRGMNYDDPVQSLHIHLKPGMQHLNGNQVQQLLRYRKSNTKGLGYPEGDRGRVAMQQSFIRALVDQKCTVSNLANIPGIITSIKEGIKTNMSIVEMTKYAKYLKNFSSENITAYQLPGEGNGTDYGASYWICNLEETKELVENVFGYDASKITIDSPDGSSKSKDKKESKSSSSDSSSKASEATEAPKEIPDNSDEEDYSASSARVTNPPLPTKIPASLKPAGNNDNENGNNPDLKENVISKYDEIKNHKSTSAPEKPDTGNPDSTNDPDNQKNEPVRITPAPGKTGAKTEQTPPDDEKDTDKSDKSPAKTTSAPVKSDDEPEKPKPASNENNDEPDTSSENKTPAEPDTSSENETKTAPENNTKKDIDVISLD